MISVIYIDGDTIYKATRGRDLAYQQPAVGVTVRRTHDDSVQFFRSSYDDDKYHMMVLSWPTSDIEKAAKWLAERMNGVFVAGGREEARRVWAEAFSREAGR